MTIFFLTDKYAADLGAQLLIVTMASLAAKKFQETVIIGVCCLLQINTNAYNIPALLL